MQLMYLCLLCIYIRYPVLNTLVSRKNISYVQNNKFLILHLTCSITSKYTSFYKCYRTTNIDFCATNINSTESGNDCNDESFQLYLWLVYILFYWLTKAKKQKESLCSRKLFNFQDLLLYVLMLMLLIFKVNFSSSTRDLSYCISVKIIRNFWNTDLCVGWKLLSCLEVHAIFSICIVVYIKIIKN